MNISGLTWGLTLGGIALIFVVDFMILGRGARIVGMREAGVTAGAYVLLAALFGVGLWIFAGSQYSGEFFAGYLTEYSLSVDNLFVFVIIMASFQVPPEHQHKVLLFGIVLRPRACGAFIALGAALIEAFVGVFFLFGAFLIYTARFQLAGTATRSPRSATTRCSSSWSGSCRPTREYDGAKVRTGSTASGSPRRCCS